MRVNGDWYNGTDGSERDYSRGWWAYVRKVRDGRGVEWAWELVERWEEVRSGALCASRDDARKAADAAYAEVQAGRQASGAAV